MPAASSPASTPARASRPPRSSGPARGGVAELIAVIRDLKSDLFLQVESRHGPKIARGYPSIEKADAILEHFDRSE